MYKEVFMITSHSSLKAFLHRWMRVIPLHLFYENIIKLFILNQFERQRMNSNEMTIQYEDTSFKKYPFNKYYDYKDLNHVSRRVFDDKLQSQTLDTHLLRRKSKNTKPKLQQKRQSKKSVNTTKTMSSSRFKYKPQGMNISLTIDNYKEFTKKQIAEELHHYTKLCLNLRKENYALKQNLEQNKRDNKESLVELQRKINKFNQKALQMREKELLLEESKLKESKYLKKGKQNISNVNKPKHKARDGEFKRFFLHFLDNYGKVDEKLQRKVLHQKSIEHKLLIGQKVLKESCEFLREKKYKFSCIFD